MYNILIHFWMNSKAQNKQELIYKNVDRNLFIKLEIIRWNEIECNSSVTSSAYNLTTNIFVYQFLF